MSQAFKHRNVAELCNSFLKNFKEILARAHRGEGERERERPTGWRKQASMGNGNAAVPSPPSNPSLRIFGTHIHMASVFLKLWRLGLEVRGRPFWI